MSELEHLRASGGPITSRQEVPEFDNSFIVPERLARMTRIARKRGEDVARLWAYHDAVIEYADRAGAAEAKVAAVEALLGPGDHARWGGEPDGYLVPMSAILAALDAS